MKQVHILASKLNNHTPKTAIPSISEETMDRWYQVVGTLVNIHNVWLNYYLSNNCTKYNNNSNTKRTCCCFPFEYYHARVSNIKGMTNTKNDEKEKTRKAKLSEGRSKREEWIANLNEWITYWYCSRYKIWGKYTHWLRRHEKA